MHEIQKHKRHALCNLIRSSEVICILLLWSVLLQPLWSGKTAFVSALNWGLVISPETSSTSNVSGAVADDVSQPIFIWAIFPNEEVKNDPRWVISDYVPPEEVIRPWMSKDFKVHCMMIQFALWLVFPSWCLTSRRFVFKLQSVPHPNNSVSVCACTPCTFASQFHGLYSSAV